MQACAKAILNRHAVLTLKVEISEGHSVLKTNAEHILLYSRNRLMTNIVRVVNRHLLLTRVRSQI